MLPSTKTYSTDLKGYCHLMANLGKKITEARKKNDAALGALLYQLGSIYHSTGLSGWPDVKRADCTNGTHTYYPETLTLFPFGIPSSAADLKIRYDTFQKSVPNYQALSEKAYEEATETKCGSELIAKCLAAQASIEVSFSGTSPKDHMGLLRRLKRESSSTKFYKSFLSRCETLRNLEASQ